MKRTASAVEAPRAPRQDPVSCSNCRSKKLKCSRQEPCSNCASRGLRCDYSTKGRRSFATSVQVSQDISDVSGVIPDILTRLKRLEDAVLFERNAILTTGTTQIDAADYQHPSGVNYALSRGAASLTPTSVDERAVNQEATATPTIGDDVSDLPEKAFETCETAVTHNGALPSHHSDEVLVLYAPVSQVLALGHKITDFFDTTLTSEGVGLIRHLWLPVQEEASVLFEEYAYACDHLAHIIHTPSVRSMLDQTYKTLHQGHEVNLHDVVLLLSIFSTSAYLWTPAAGKESVFQNLEDAHRASQLWRKFTFFLLEYNRQTAFGTLQDVQASVSMLVLTVNTDGYSSRTRMLHSTAITIARDLSLHTIDAPGRRHKQPTDGTSEAIDLEVRRRVWWHIAATDWIMSNAAGPLEGVYTIHSSHMMVNHPKNLNDDDLSLGKTQSWPMSSPTTMTYYLVRLRGAELHRTVTDVLPIFTRKPETIDYKDVIHVDGLFRQFVQELPFFFRLDQIQSDQTKNAELKHPKIAIQRILVNLGSCHGRSRLHRPYLFCRSDPRFDYSRTACLESARKILEIRRSLSFQQVRMFAVSARICFVINHVFMATLTLALDLCFTRSNDAIEDKERRREVKEACSILEEAAHDSPLARKLLSALVDTLRKHGLRLQDPAESIAGGHDSSTRPHEKGADAEGSATVDDFPFPMTDLSEWDLQELLGSDPCQNAPDWDQLFADLELCYPV